MNTTSTNSFSWTQASLVSFCVGLLVVCLSIFLQTRGVTASFVAVSPTPAVSTTQGVGASFTVPSTPERLVIPAIGVDAHIQSVGLSWRGNGDMGVPTNFTDVAWYREGPLPGAPGSAVIDGHLDGKDVPQAVFFDLGKLKIGDLVEVIDTKGKTLQFRVVDTKTYDYDATTTDIFSGDLSKARLNLITCAGDWLATQKQYTQRIVVFTELVPAS